MRLKILPKKGDKRDLNNWRGVMLTDTQYRIVAMMADARLGRIAPGDSSGRGARGWRRVPSGIPREGS